MTAEMDRDLEAFARGELTREQLVAAHGDEAGRLADLHQRMERTLETPFDETGGWTRIAQEMDAGATVTTLRRTPRPRRVLALGVAAAMMIGGSALAAVEVHVRNGRGFEGPALPAHTGTPDPTPAGPGPGTDGDTASESPTGNDGGGAQPGDTGGQGSGENSQGGTDQGTSSGDGNDQGTSSSDGSGSGNDQGTSGSGDQGTSTGQNQN